MTVEVTLAEFLLARIAEDEAVGRRLDAVGWYGSLHGSFGACIDDEVISDAIYGAADPLRLLAECEARRRIVERAVQTQRDYDHGTNEWALAEADLRDLAWVHVHHPDYRDEWQTATGAVG